MRDVILSIVSSLTLSGLLAAAVVFLARSWISQRLRSAIENEYARKLETYKARLSAEQELALERLKASNAENQAVQAAATASLTATHMASQERRLEALETFWKATVELRAKSPAALTYVDILVPEEYDELLRNPKLSPALDRVTEQTLDAQFDVGTAHQVDNARLYAGEYLFSLFFAYRAITGRIALMLMDGRKNRKIENWAQDSGIRGLMRLVLSGREVEEFDKLRLGRIMWLGNQIESKMLAHSWKIISGEASAEFGLQQASKIAAAASALEIKQRAERPAPQPGG